MIDLSVQTAVPDDVPHLLEFIRSLAGHVGRARELGLTEAVLHEALFGSPSKAEAIVSAVKGSPVGFVLFSRTFASFSGRPGLFIEDIFVREDHRRRGIGGLLMKEMARIAAESGCTRIDWFVSEANEGATAFWRGVGADSPPGRRWLRLDADAIAALADGMSGAQPK